MIPAERKEEYYQALLEKNSEYEGVFYVGVKTTGVFCRPLSHPNHVSDWLRMLVEAVEANPEKRWRDEDFRQLSVDASTARRQFKKRFGMTYVEYARARRMGLALGNIRAGRPVIDAQLSTGYESSSGFRDAFSRMMGAAPTRLGGTTEANAMGEA